MIPGGRHLCLPQFNTVYNSDNSLFVRIEHLPFFINPLFRVSQFVFFHFLITYILPLITGILQNSGIFFFLVKIFLTFVRTKYITMIQ